MHAFLSFVRTYLFSVSMPSLNTDKNCFIFRQNFTSNHPAQLLRGSPKTMNDCISCLWIQIYSYRCSSRVCVLNARRRFHSDRGHGNACMTHLRFLAPPFISNRADMPINPCMISPILFIFNPLFDPLPQRLNSHFSTRVKPLCPPLKMRTSVQHPCLRLNLPLSTAELFSWRFREQWVTSSDTRVCFDARDFCQVSSVQSKKVNTLRLVSRLCQDKCPLFCPSKWMSWIR